MTMCLECSLNRDHNKAKMSLTQRCRDTVPPHRSSHVQCHIKRSAVCSGMSPRVTGRQRQFSEEKQMSPHGEISLHVFKRAVSCNGCMILINDREEVEGRGLGQAATDNQHKYPFKGSEGNIAASVGLSAKGLINDISVVWRWFSPQSYSSPLGPERLKSRLLLYNFTHYKSNRKHYLQ